MFDPITLAVGAVIAAGSYAAGHLHRPRRRDNDKPQAVCGCGHGLDKHDPDTSRCHGEVLHKEARTEDGIWIGNQWVPCTCRQYVGPKPIEALFAPTYLPPSEG